MLVRLEELIHGSVSPKINDAQTSLFIKVILISQPTCMDARNLITLDILTKCIPTPRLGYRSNTKKKNKLILHLQFNWPAGLARPMLWAARSHRMPWESSQLGGRNRLHPCLIMGRAWPSNSVSCRLPLDAAWALLVGKTDSFMPLAGVARLYDAVSCRLW